MKEYSEKLLDNISQIDMSDSLKERQRNWIGKSEGIRLSFDIVNEIGETLDTVNVFTTCIETIYGVSFVLLAPEHDFVDKHQDHIINSDAALDYRKQTALRTEFARIYDQKDKTGCELQGIYAVNPVKAMKVPIYLADFVLKNYGTGAVMAVACHDQRDYEFAQTHDIPMLQIIEGDCRKCAVEKQTYMAENRKMINSEEFTDMPVRDARNKIAEKVIAEGVGEKWVNYKMQDWSFNRQRYWGEPFPVVFCNECGTVPLKEDDLPLVLPDTDDYLPNEQGDSPLSKVTEWMQCKCPKCGGAAQRETDTMPNWAGSSWYWLRYVDPHNDSKLADFEKLKYWGSVDCYTGGTEHITRHVLYAFFWHNFLFDIGVVPHKNPFIRKMGSGLILDDNGKKMSKSSTNGVSPVAILDKFGADVARMHVHFLGGYEDNTPWTFNGIDGVSNFLNRVWALQDMIKAEEISEEHIYHINYLTKKIGEDIENLKLNTAIAAYMSFVKKVRADGFISKEELRRFLILLNPIAPHITSELFETIYGSQILDESWPDYDDKYIIEDTVDLPIQHNGRLKTTIKVVRGISENDLIELIRATHPNILPEDVVLKRVIYIPDKIINLIY